MCNAWNHPITCPCGFGGDTGGGGRSSSPEQHIPTWDLRDRGERLIYLTSCWWCDAEVYFFRDENGGCVLFDELGAPWAVHPCWSEHRQSRSPALSGIRDRLQSDGYNGRFYRPNGKKLRRPSSRDRNCRVYGFVADNYALYEDKKPIQFRAGGRAAAGDFFTLLVADSEQRLWPFLARGEVGRKIQDYEIVIVDGVWVRRGRRWLLFASRVETRSPDTDSGTLVEEFTLPARLRCWYCRGTTSGRGLWGLDSDWRVECPACGQAKGKMPSDAFLRLCRRVVSNAKRRSRAR